MGPETDVLQGYERRGQEVVLAPTSCYVGRQNHGEKRNWMLAIFYSNRSTPDNTLRCSGGHMASEIPRKDDLERGIDRIVSASPG